MSSPKDNFEDGYLDCKENQDVPLLPSGDEVVITGISGIFPSSENVTELMENLYNKVDMVIAVDPKLKLAEMPKHQGLIKSLHKFDAQFFKVTFNQARAMDPMNRKLMEQAYSAIYDAGFNPLDFGGSKIGVFVGIQYMDTTNTCLYENSNMNSFFLSGCSKTMLANRISYWMNGKAPSYSGDFSCSASLACLEQAYHCIKSGQCDAAVVGCCNICLLPRLFVNLNRSGMLCLDGKTKCFDKHGDGFVRSDTISAIFLQKAKDARRIYSEVCHAKSKYSLKNGDKFSATRTVDEMTNLYKEFYSEIDVPPENVEYVEANATAIAEADANEMEAIGNFFGKKSPIQIGSIKSNMGNSEAAAGLCSVMKVCLAYHTGKLAGNLHYSEPHDIPSIHERKLKVVVDNTPFKRGYVALNNFSYNGLDAHVLLKGHYKPKDKKRYVSPIPYLITVSARQEDCVNKVLTELESQVVDAELIALLHKIYEKSTMNHMGRGYIILDTNEKGETISLTRSSSYLSGETRPICFMYSGMGSQWSGMGAELMRIPIFKSAIMKCHSVLNPKGIDVINIISNSDKKMFDNILNSFIGITAVQIGLTDIMKEIGIVPDLLIGHSLGEMGCAYADGCFTIEETILTSYSRGLASSETNFIPGAMAAVGLGYKDIIDLVPPEIDIACHNSSASSTISGPAEAVASFVEVLKSRGIFAKEVQSSGISYHSRYTAIAGPKLLEGLRSIILHPKPRSEKWLCTSIPKEKWNEPLAKFSSAEYHVNNLLSPVYFEETCNLIPKNAVIIEIAPHGLMQAILKRSNAECTNIPLTKRGNSDPVKFLLQAIGKMYESGLDTNIATLYPKVKFPVSTETPLLSHFVQWDHSESWPVVHDAGTQMITTGYREVVISIHDDEYSFIRHYIRNGVNFLPESFLLFLVWETMAMSKGINYRRFPVKFNDIKFHSELIIDAETPSKLSININKNENRFEVLCKEKILATGFVSYHEIQKNTAKEIIINNDVDMYCQDIYKILQHRGYSYKENFQSIYSASTDCEQCIIKWTEEWAILIDALIQLNILAQDFKGVVIPKLIQELIIDVYEHDTCKKINIDNAVCFGAEYNEILRVSRCGGVELKNIVFQNIPSPQGSPDVLCSKEFIPNFPTDYYDLNSALNILIQIITENIPKKNIKFVELTPSLNISLLESIKNIIEMTPMNINVEYQQIYKQDEEKILSKPTKIDKTIDVLLVYDLLQDKQKINEIRNCLQSNAYLLALENSRNIKNIAENKCFNIISAIRISKESILILLKTYNDFESFQGISYIKIDNYYKFSWLKKVYSDLSSKKKIVLLSVNQPYNGIKGIVTSLSRKHGNRLSLVKINDIDAPLFDIENDFYKEQLQKQLIINVLQEGQWGGFYYLPNRTQYIETINNYALKMSHAADLKSFKWCEIPTNMILSRTVKVHYAGLSLKDVHKALGKVEMNDAKFGMDFSGIDFNGNRVMGLTSGGTVANMINVESDLVWPVPKHWTLKEAATVPLAYVHAYYCLTMRAILYKGVSVIVTGGAGALGQAIISICLAYGHTVYTTVTDNGKKLLLLKLFPQLKENQIFNSNDTSSAALIMSVLKNSRRNVVINCDSGIFRQELMACVGFMGYFLDISKDDARKNEIMGMASVGWARNYIAVDLNNIYRPENEQQRKELQLIIAEGISKGIVKPLTSTEYSTQEIEKAFNLLLSRKHRGKVLINLQNSPTNKIKCSPRITCSSDKSFIVICDSQELGLEIIDFLVQRNVKNVILHLRKKRLSGYGTFKLKSWKKQNIRIKLLFDDIESEEGCCNILNEAVKVAPVEGIFVFIDRIEDKFNDIIIEDDYLKKINKFTSGILNIEAISRDLMTDTLRYFTIVSQSNQNIFEEYVNSVYEEICRARNALGLPGLLFQAEGLNQSSKIKIMSNMIEPQDIATLYSSLEKSLSLNLSNAATFYVKENTYALNSKFNGLPDLQIAIGTNGTQKIDQSFRPECKNTIRSKENFNGGLGAFYNYIDDDIYRATEPFIPMATRIVNTFPEENEVDPNGTYLMLIPGFEGHSQIFTLLCERLKIKALTIQLEHVANKASITEMALEILKLIKKRMVLKDKFYLLGYSFGINIALELTNLLEKDGHVGTVYCLDSSPDVLRKQIDSYLGHLSDIQLQNTIIAHMFNLVGKEVVVLNDDICKQDWDKKIDYFVQKVKAKVNYPHEYLKSVLNSIYKRIILAQSYHPSYKLNSQLILIRGLSHPDSTGLAFDYNLSKYTNEEVKIFHIESDTAMAPYDFRVANIVNKMLDPALLEEFNNSSSCEVYFVANSGFDSMTY